MMLPEFLHFYQGYTVQTALAEYARTFFALLNSMYRVQANEGLANILEVSVPHLEKREAENIISQYKRQSEGIPKLLEEVKTIRSVRGKK